MGTSKTKVTFTKDMLIKDIAKACDKEPKDIKDIYAEFERAVTGYLAQANEDTDVVVKLFEGVSFNSVFEPEAVKKNNFTGQDMVVASKIKPKANFTRTYRDRLLGNI